MKKTELINMIQEAVVKLQRPHPIFEANKMDIEQFYKDVKKKKIPFKEAYKVMLDKYYYEFYDLMEDDNNTFGGGQWEQFMGKCGYKLSSADVQSTYGTKDDLYSLVTNIFYNTSDGLKKLIPTSTLKWIADKIMKDKYIADNPEQVEVDNKKNNRPDAKELYDYIKKINA